MRTSCDYLYKLFALLFFFLYDELIKVKSFFFFRKKRFNFINSSPVFIAFAPVCHKDFSVFFSVLSFPGTVTNVSFVKTAV